MNIAFILMLLTLAVMALGFLAPITTIPIMIFWGTLGIMDEVKKLSKVIKSPPPVHPAG